MLLSLPKVRGVSSLIPSSAALVRSGVLYVCIGNHGKAFVSSISHIYVHERDRQLLVGRAIENCRCGHAIKQSIHEASNQFKSSTARLSYTCHTASTGKDRGRPKHDPSSSPSPPLVLTEASMERIWLSKSVVEIDERPSLISLCVAAGKVGGPSFCFFHTSSGPQNTAFSNNSARAGGIE